MKNLIKYIDGQPVECSPEESALIQSMWAMSQQYPEFAEAVSFDGVNPPSYDVPSLKRIFLESINKAIEAGIKDMTQKIEIAQEEGQDPAEFFLQRKMIRAAAANLDCSAGQTPEDFLALKPSCLLPYWPIPNAQPQ